MAENKEGYKSWLYSFACSAIMGLMMCPYRLSGLLFVALLEQYNTDREKASMPVFMCFLMFGLTGPLAGWMGQKIGVELTTLIGCFIAAFGFGMTYFALNITFAIISIGLLYGFGMTVSTTLIPNILKKHFTKNYNSASGISLAGPCIGALIFPPIAIYMLNAYGVSGTFLIIGAIMLNGVPTSMLLYSARRSIIDSPKRLNKVNTVEECFLTPNTHVEIGVENFKFSNDIKIAETTYSRTGTGKKESVVGESRDSDPKSETKTLLENSDSKSEERKHCLPETNTYIVNNFGNQKYPKDINFTDTTHGLMHIKNHVLNCTASDVYEMEYKEINKLEATAPCIEQNSESFSQKESQISQRTSFDLYKNLLPNPAFLVLMTAVSLHLYIATIVWTTIIDYSRDKRIDKKYEVYLLMFPSMMDLIGRLSFVWIIDKKYISSSMFSIIANVMLAFSCGIIILSTNISAFMSGTLLFGLGTGSLLATYPGQVFEFMEKDYYIVAMASLKLLYVPLSFTASPLIEYFRTDLLSYDGLYYLIIALCLLSCCITPLMSRFSKVKKVKKKKLKCMDKTEKTASSKQTM